MTCYRFSASARPKVALVGLWLALVWLVTGSPLLAAPKVAVVGLHAAPGLQDRAAVMAPLLRDAFRQSSAFAQPLETSFLAGQRAVMPLSEILFEKPARDRLEEARIYAEQAQFRKAVEALEQALGFLFYYQEHLTSQALLLSTLEQAAQLHYALGEAEVARERLTQLLLISPDHRLDPLRFSPQNQDDFLSIKASLLRTSGMEITSRPGPAEVFLDGAPRGRTPLVLENLPAGRHFLRLEDANGRTFYQSVETKDNQRLEVRAELGTPLILAASREGGPVKPDPARLQRLYLDVGRLLGADYVCVGVLDENGLEVQLLRVQDGSLSISFQAAVRAGAAVQPRVLKGLVDQLASTLKSDGSLLRTAPSLLMAEPDTNLELARLVFGRQSADAASMANRASNTARKPVYKRGWFWAAVGGVVLASAGGATAGVVLATQGAESTPGIQFNLPGL